MQKNGRIPYYYKDQLVYEWEQNLEEIIIYIKAPECILEKNREIIKKNLKPGQKMPKLDIKIDDKNKENENIMYIFFNLTIF